MATRIAETSHIKHVTLTTSRLLSALQTGKQNSLNSLDGWDVNNSIGSTGTGGSADVDDTSYYAQRFIFSTQSVGRLRFDFEAYLSDTNYNAGSTLFATIYTDTTTASSGPVPSNLWVLSGISGLYALGGAILGAAKVGIPAEPQRKGPSVAIPFGQLPTSKPVGDATTTTAEFDLSQTPIVPGQYFWIALSTQSAGSTDVTIVTSGANQNPSHEPGATSSDGVKWTGNQPDIHYNLYPQLALNSAGATGYGNGNILTVWDSLGQGNAFQAISPPGAAQGYSQVDITTSFVATQNRLGKTDVYFPTSVGTSAGFQNKFSRFDYTATITFEKF